MLENGEFELGAETVFLCRWKHAVNKLPMSSPPGFLGIQDTSQGLGCVTLWLCSCCCGSAHLKVRETGNFVTLAHIKHAEFIMNPFQSDPVLGPVCNGSSLQELNMQSLARVPRKSYILFGSCQEEEAGEWGLVVVLFCQCPRGLGDWFFVNKMRNG